MKWIGQHIWDFVSRFRNDVYFEGLTETEETRGLVVDANGKVSINPLSGDEHATHVYENVRNDEGATIPVGTPVYSKGEVGGSERIKVGIADASDPAKMPAIGITNTELTTTGDTKDGLITLVGVYNTNLSGFSGVSENDVVYVASGGGLTITKPTGVNLIQNVGIVLKTNGPGTIIQGLAVTCIGRTNDVPTPLYIDHANQRVGIGATSPDEKLEVDGRIKLQTSAGSLTIKEAGAGSVALTSSATIVMEAPSNFRLNTGASLVENFTVLSTGNVGIGTNNPAYKLDINSSNAVGARISSSGFSNLDLVSERTSGNLGGIRFKQDVDSYITNEFLALHGGGFDWKIGDGSSLPDIKMSLDSNGNVGIGTTSPGQKLHVVGDARIQGNLTVNGTYTQIDTDVLTTEQWLVTNDGTGPAAVINQLGTEDIFDVQDDGTSVFYIEDGGNVGIGTTSPSHKLDVNGGAQFNTKTGAEPFYITRLGSTDQALSIKVMDDNVRFESIQDEVANNYGGFDFRMDGGVTEPNFVIRKNAADPILHVDGGGNVGIGTASPHNKAHITSSGNQDGLLLDLNTGASGDYTGVYFKVDNNTTNAYKKGGLVWERTGSYNEGRFHFLLNNEDNTNNVDLTDSKLTILSTGNVGIGTTSPQSPLHVHTGDGGTYSPNSSHDDLTIEGSGNIGLQLFSPNSTYQYIAFGDPESANAGYVRYHHGSNTMVLRTNNQDRVNIDSSGNVGIGTTSPGEKLDVNGVVRIGNGGAWATSAGAVQLTYDTSTAQGVLSTYYDTTSLRLGAGISQKTGITINGQSNANGNNITFRVGNSDRVHIDSSGNVGIGTTSPSSQLEISKDSDDGTDSPTLSITNASTTLNDGADIGTIQFKNSDLSGSGPHIATIKGVANSTDERTAELAFSTCNVSSTSEAMRIDNFGNVGIGTTSPAYKLSVNGDVQSDFFRGYQYPTGSYLDFDDDTLPGSNGTALVSISSMKFMVDSNNNSTNDAFSWIVDGLPGSGTTLMTLLDEGYLGIGTASPVYELDIDGQARIQSTNYEMLYLHQADANGGFIKFTNTDDTDGWYAGISGSEEFIISRTADNSAPIITAEQNGRVGIGTTSPSEKLEVSGKILATGGQIRAGSYLESYPSFSFADDIDTGMFSDTADQLEFATGGSSRVTINSSGNVGVGTTSPGYRFVVNSYSADTVAKFESTDSIARLELKDNNDAAYVGTQNNKAFIGMEANATGTNNLIVTSDGNVGIGTNNPSSKLHVDGSATFTGATFTGNVGVTGTGNLTLRNTSSTGSGIIFLDNIWQAGIEHDSGKLYFRTGGQTDRMTIHSSGNVGIGTTSPAYKLDVRNSSTLFYGQTDLTDTTSIFRIRANGGSSEILEIEANGNVGIGTATPSEKLEVNGNVQASSYKISGVTVLSGSANVSLGSSGATGTISLNTHTSTALYVAGDDNVGIGTTSPSEKLEVDGNIKIGDSNEARFGAGNDLRIYHDGSNNYIQGVNGDLYIQNGSDDKDIILRSDDGSGGQTAYLTLDGSEGHITVQKEMHFQDTVVARFGTDNDAQIVHSGNSLSIVNQTGDFNVVQNANDGDITFQCDDGSGGTTTYLRVDGGNESIKFYKDISNQANANLVMGGGQIKFSDAGRFYAGDSNDLQIYHDGSNSYIVDAGTGDLLNYFSNEWKVIKYGSSETCIEATSDGSVDLYYDNSKKFETTSTGVEVTGNINVSGSVQRQISTTHHTFTTVNGGSAAQDYWVPFIGTNELAAPNVTHRTVAPYGGILKKAIVHSTAAFGTSAQVRFHRIDNGTASVFTNDNNTDDVTTNVTRSLATAYTSTEFIFTTGNTFSAGDQIGVSFVRNNTAQGDVAMTLVWEYELF